ncbi:MAG: metallophosphoesterase [Paludibacteraceae bacterium]|nr:metallophosphoesterase [Paludibacteraceae bacterium]
MRRGLKIVFWIILLAAGVLVCALRWQAWFGTPAEPRWTGDTLVYVFPPFEQDTTPQSLDILVLGDVHNRLTKADYDTLASRVPQADIVLQTGDWMERGQSYYYQSLLREWTQSGLYGLPVIACPGNHEYSKGLGKTLSPIWEEAFSYPHNGPAEVPGAHYFVDLPSMRVIVIDTNPLVRAVYVTRTLTWLRRVMKEAGDRYVVVMMHHPVLSPAKGRFNAEIYAAFRRVLGEADLVLAGHDHSYMRRTPFVVLNTAGKPKPQRERLIADKTDSIPVYGVLSVGNPQSSNHQPSMEFRIFSLQGGELLDSLYVHHD